MVLQLPQNVLTIFVEVALRDVPVCLPEHLPRYPVVQPDGPVCIAQRDLWPVLTAESGTGQQHGQLRGLLGHSGLDRCNHPVLCLPLIADAE